MCDGTMLLAQAIISMSPFVVWFLCKSSHPFIYGSLKILAHLMVVGTPALETRHSLLYIMIHIYVFVYFSFPPLTRDSVLLSGWAYPGPFNFQVLA